MNPTTGHTEQIPKLVEIIFGALLLAAVVPPPILWVTVLVWTWRLRKSPLEALVGP
jgi:hypothetical protein